MRAPVTFNRLHLIRQVDLFTLRLFLSAVEEQQIGRAAMREHIAASTATKRIQDLEEIAGVPLLERTPKGVAATPAGEVLVRCIRTIFGSLDDMGAEIAAFSEGMRGQVTVTSARTIISPFLARELGEYARDFPNVSLIVRELQNADIVPAVARGEADMGVFAAAPGIDRSAVEVVPYRKDRLVAIVPNASPLAQRASVTFEDLLTENVITPGGMLGAFRGAAKRLGREFNPRYDVTSAEVAISLVQAGLGVTVIPECAVRVDAFDVATLDLAEPWAVRTINIATARALNPAVRALMKQLLDRPKAGIATEPAR